MSLTLTRQDGSRVVIEEAERAELPDPPLSVPAASPIRAYLPQWQLDPAYDWIIGTDSVGRLLLVPVRKENK